MLYKGYKIIDEKVAENLFKRSESRDSYYKLMYHAYGGIQKYMITIDTKNYTWVGAKQGDNYRIIGIESLVASK